MGQRKAHSKGIYQKVNSHDLPRKILLHRRGMPLDVDLSSKAGNLGPYDTNHSTAHHIRWPKNFDLNIVRITQIIIF